MNMPITLEILDGHVHESDFEKIFNYFQEVENRFSIFKNDSEVSLINHGRVKPEDYSFEMCDVLTRAEETRVATNNYFNIYLNNKINPSGLVKGWATYNAAEMLKKNNFKKFYIEAGGDIQAAGKSWKVGIRNPFDINQVVKVLNIENKGVATSGSYIRGHHIVNPNNLDDKLEDIVSITVIGPNVYEADRFATAAFAMGRDGINFIESLSGFDAYMIDKDGIATKTSNFEQYV